MPSWFVIFISLMVALVLMLVPMPDWTVWLRPAWVLLVLIYWTMTMPYRVGMGTAWLMGLVVDLATNTLIGEHALAYTVIIYFVSRIYIRLRMAPMVQQGLSIFVFVLLYQFILFCVQGFNGALPSSQLYWLSSLTSMLLWPWLFIIMRDFRKRFKVA